MAAVSGVVFDFDHIIGMVNYISDISKTQYDLELTSSAKLQIIEDVLSHYYDHIEAYHLSVTGSDPFKFLAWAGIFIYESLYKTDREAAIKFLSSTVVALSDSLELLDKSFTELYLSKILKMVINEYDNDNHIGLGKNGLYMAFKSASIV